MKHEPYEKRLLRIFEQAGYDPADILTLQPEELVEIPNITVPNIRTVLFLQRKAPIPKSCRNCTDRTILKFLEELGLDE